MAKPDPFFARPDGKRAQSAWLTKLQTEARDSAEKANTDFPRRDPRYSFVPDNTLEQNLEFLRNHYQYARFEDNLPVCECLLQWHGELALPHLEPLLKRKEAVKLIATLQSEAVQALFLRHLDLLDVRNALANNAKKWPCYVLRELLAKNPSRDQPAAHLLQRLLQNHPEWLQPLQATLKDEGDEAQAKSLSRLLAPTEQVTDARIDELPPLFRNQPWLADKNHIELPALTLTPRREPAIVDWSRWQGGALDPRPRERFGWKPILRICFDDNRSQLHDFLASENLLPLLPGDLFERAFASDKPYYDIDYDYFLGSQEDAELIVANALDFLESTGRQTSEALKALRNRNDLSCAFNFWKWSLRISRAHSAVEHEFNRKLDTPLSAVTANLQAQAETEPGLQGMALFLWGVIPERIPTALETESVAPEDLRKPPGDANSLLGHLSYLSDALALAVLRLQSGHVSIETCPMLLAASNSDRQNPVARLLKRFGVEQIETVFAVMPSASTEMAQTVMSIVDWDVLALDLSKFGYTAYGLQRAFAQRWLLAHPRTTARALIPAAFSEDAEAASHARRHLYLLSAEGHHELLKAEAQAYGDQAVAAVEQLLATAPEALLPAQLPKLPAWLVKPRLPRLMLAGRGHAIPLTNLPDALMPLALSKGGVIYPGLEKLQAAVTPDSLARLMLALFNQWLDNGTPAKDRWIFELQGRLGDDANARALASRILLWRANTDRIRSYEGLEYLAQIGTDTALMLLSTFGELKRYGDLQDRAAKALARVAEERGLTLEQLADRTVPTLGLDERGRMTLDFGPRQFVASLNTDLHAQIHDAEGVQRKDLPKPGAKDDAALAKAAIAAWKELKQQAKLVGGLQTIRLEAAMCTQRRWPAADFLACFAHHPVLRTQCQRLVWATFAASGAVTGTFRVSEDLSLTDADEAPFALDAGAVVGLPHAMELEESQRDRWMMLLAEYEIFQPFEQLARLVYAMSNDELSLRTLPRFDRRKLSTGSLLGLEQRGWKREPGNGGIVNGLKKPLGERHEAFLSFAPGWYVRGIPDADEQQDFGDVYLLRATSDARPGSDMLSPPSWRELAPILRSEIVRDLERLAWHTRD